MLSKQFPALSYFLHTGGINLEKQLLLITPKRTPLQDNFPNNCITPLYASKYFRKLTIIKKILCPFPSLILKYFLVLDAKYGKGQSKS